MPTFSFNFGSIKAGLTFGYAVYSWIDGNPIVSGTGTLDARGTAVLFGLGNNANDAALAITVETSPAYLADGQTAFNLGAVSGPYGYVTATAGVTADRSTQNIIDLGHGCGFVLRGGISASFAGAFKVDNGIVFGGWGLIQSEEQFNEPWFLAIPANKRSQ